MADKYRGTVSYHLVYQELITATRYRGLTTYQELATIVGLPLRGSHMSAQTGRMLGEIVEDELAHGRPMLSALCVGVSGAPGSGFFALARRHGRLHGEGQNAELAFWEQERQAVYETWARTYIAG